MTIFPPCGEDLARPREVERVDGVLVLLEGKERLQTRHVQESYMPTTVLIHFYASAAASILLLLSPEGLHLNNNSCTLYW